MPLLLLAIISYFLLTPAPAIAYDLTATTTATVSATVPANQGPPSGDTTAPSVPILLRPVDGTYTNHSRPEFVWLQSTDDSNSLSYDLYLNHVATYLGINNYGGSLTESYVARIEDGSVRLIPANNLPDGIYDWYVVAYDRSGNQQGSASWHLVIDTVAPPLTFLSPTTAVGPATIPLTFSSEPYVTITIAIYNPTDNTTLSFSLPTERGSRVTFTPTLAVGEYQLFAEASDQSGNTTTLSPITLTITQGIAITPTIPLPPPLTSIPPIYLPPLASLPATAMLVATRVRPATPYLFVIALIIYILLITRRKYNLRVLSAKTHQPLNGVILTDARHHSYRTNKRGKTMIRDLTDHIYLLVELPDSSLPISLCILRLTPPLTTIEL